MKLLPLSFAIVLVLVGAFFIKLSLDQEATMKLYTHVHGAGKAADPASTTGLASANYQMKEPEQTAATERSEAMVVTEQERVLMRDERNQLANERAVLADKQSDLRGWEDKVKESEAKVAAMQAECMKIADNIKAEFKESLPDLSVDTEMSAFVEAVKSTVESCKEELVRLETDYEESVVVRGAATVLLAENELKLRSITTTNNNFFNDYMRNSDEFAITAVDKRWNFVVFNVGAESGLIPGDSTPVLVKHANGGVTHLRITDITAGQAVAEYDPKLLPAGVSVEVGDVVFRRTPLGH